jgi:ATP-dependent phosphoenolpyruvate carboxykinase
MELTKDCISELEDKLIENSQTKIMREKWKKLEHRICDMLKRPNIYVIDILNGKERECDRISILKINRQE